MKFSAIDPSGGAAAKMPVIYWLSGLTCTDRNFIEKAGAFEAAAKHGVLIGLNPPALVVCSALSTSACGMR